MRKKKPKPRAQTGVRLITAERRRQIAEEGFTAANDDSYGSPALAYAGVCYANNAHHYANKRRLVPRDWPFAAGWWKPSKDPVANLVKAGALIAAEIDRLLRAKRKEQK